MTREIISVDDIVNKERREFIKKGIIWGGSIVGGASLLAFVLDSLARKSPETVGLSFDPYQPITHDKIGGIYILGGKDKDNKKVTLLFTESRWKKYFETYSYYNQKEDFMQVISIKVKAHKINEQFNFYGVVDILEIVPMR